jgi:hypothetical protein
MKENYGIEEAIKRLEVQNRWMRRALAVLFILCVGGMAALGWRVSRDVPSAAVNPNSILKVRGLVVTDGNGIDRVWIGSPLPNPPLFGKRYKRMMSVSGILMFDADGNERSGYVTTDSSGGNVFLSMDSVGSETAECGASAGGGARLELHDGTSQLSLAAFQAGPEMKMAVQGKTVFQQPVNASSEKK